MDALWIFLLEHGVETTNNRSERALRFAVMWRKAPKAPTVKKVLGRSNASCRSKKSAVCKLNPPTWCSLTPSGATSNFVPL
jgi:hypothetical protein